MVNKWELYATGKGSITIRGVINIEELNLGKGKHKKCINNFRTSLSNQ